MESKYGRMRLIVYTHLALQTMRLHAMTTRDATTRLLWNLDGGHWKLKLSKKCRIK